MSPCLTVLCYPTRAIGIDVGRRLSFFSAGIRRRSSSWGSGALPPRFPPSPPPPIDRGAAPQGAWLAPHTHRPASHPILPSPRPPSSRRRPRRRSRRYRPSRRPNRRPRRCDLAAADLRRRQSSPHEPLWPCACAALCILLSSPSLVPPSPRSGIFAAYNRGPDFGDRPHIRRRVFRRDAACAARFLVIRARVVGGFRR